MKPRSPLRVAVAGAGLMGRWHAFAARRAGARVAAIVDPDRRAALALASRHGAHVSADLSQCLDDVDIVHVCTPTTTHADIAQRAVAAGKHVLVEKPVAASGAETRRLLDAAAERRVLLCPVHQFLFQEGVIRALRSAQRIGPFRHVDMCICSAGADGLDDESRDQFVLDVLPHQLAVLVRLVGHRVASLRWSVARSCAGELRGCVDAGGVSVSLLISCSGRPTQNQMRLIGSKGTMYVDMFHGFASLRGPRVSGPRKIAGPFAAAAMTFNAAAANLVRRAWMREPAYPGLLRLVDLFYEAVRTGSPAPISAEEILDVALTRDTFAKAIGRMKAGAGSSANV